MAEIKSTLDLVMEKTQRLHMSEEDKRKQAAQELAETVRGLVSKRLDGQISLDRFKTELNRLEQRDLAHKISAAEIAGRLDPLAHNSSLLDLLKYGLDLDISGMEEILKRFAQRFRSAQEQAEQKARSDLLKKAISGPALIPNLEAHAQWRENRKTMLKTVREELAAHAARLSRCG